MQPPFAAYCPFAHPPALHSHPLLPFCPPRHCPFPSALPSHFLILPLQLPFIWVNIWPWPPLAVSYPLPCTTWPLLYGSPLHDPSLPFPSTPSTLSWGCPHPHTFHVRPIAPDSLPPLINPRLPCPFHRSVPPLCPPHLLPFSLSLYYRPLPFPFSAPPSFIVPAFPSPGGEVSRELTIYQAIMGTSLLIGSHEPVSYEN